MDHQGSTRSPQTSEESDFDVVLRPWRQEFWSSISTAAKEKRCFAETDYDIAYDLDREKEKFIKLRTWVKKLHEGFPNRAGKPEFVYKKDGKWELTFMNLTVQGSAGHWKGKRYCTGFTIEGLDDKACELIHNDWQTVDASEIPGDDKVNSQLVNPPRKFCVVM